MGDPGGLLRQAVRLVLASAGCGGLGLSWQMASRHFAQKWSWLVSQRRFEVKLGLGPSNPCLYRSSPLKKWSNAPLGWMPSAVDRSRPAASMVAARSRQAARRM